MTSTAPTLGFDSVTVVDVEIGHLIPAQRVVTEGNCIRMVGAVSEVKLPQGATVVDGRGKYLIPGLWDPPGGVLRRSRRGAAHRSSIRGARGERDGARGLRQRGRIIDHVRFTTGWPHPKGHQIFDACFSRQSVSIEQCRLLAERFRRRDTWLVMDAVWNAMASETAAGVNAMLEGYWERGALPTDNWLHDLAKRATDSAGFLRVARQLDWPILAGSDRGARYSGIMLHVVLAAYVQEGLTPLAALRSGTLNPAQMLHATDSLGTVVRGKLADLVLLDGDPLADITNTTAIRAVVANGRYFDRAALDAMSLAARAETKKAEAKQAQEQGEAPYITTWGTNGGKTPVGYFRARSTARRRARSSAESHS